MSTLSGKMMTESSIPLTVLRLLATLLSGMSILSGKCRLWLHGLGLLNSSPLDRTGPPWTCTSPPEDLEPASLVTLFLGRRWENKMNSQKLALYIHAMLAACMNPRDFFGKNLVLELRRMTEENANYTNPFQILVLCNAGDTMTSKDVEKVTAAFNSQHRPFWTGTKALAILAIACLSSKPNLVADEKILNVMQQELKSRQLKNGTVDNSRTTALVVQALLVHDSYNKDFNMDLAIHSILDSVKGNISQLNAYYALPVLSNKSLLNISSVHCKKAPDSEMEALEKVLDVDGEVISVQYSIWIGDKVELARTWQLKAPLNNSIYDIVETIAKIDNRQKVEYNVMEGKPFVTSLAGLEDDPETGTFWFLHVKTMNSDEETQIIEQSPVDVRLKPNQEIILWYKSGSWNPHLRAAESKIPGITKSRWR
ncbi:sortilin-related receptor [Trichonephila inaurata madagascariensis]|uniref:Sortilin-related receptor n=1 Tax=Trichonephila inaurata madagascariensis TaxID=2747483 RepID=A0A8X6YRD2_9ARAC|nr:sortilin-related receptor [Trichonephila inaurata madagascariensis]